MKSHEALDAYHATRMEQAIASFRSRGFEATTFDSGTEAVDYFFSEVESGKTVGYGGSETVQRLGIRAKLSERSYNFLDRSEFGHSYAEQLAIRRQTLSADVFIASANAVSIEGALVNIDGDGNRIAGLSLGPSRVFLFIGRNKLEDDLERALYRARNVASPALAMQLGKNTPCAKTGRCHDCTSPDRICSHTSIIERCNPPGRIHLLFINEDLGL